MTKRPRIGHDGTSRQEMANDKVSQPQEGDQGQVGGPQVPLLSHGSAKSGSGRVDSGCFMPVSG